MGWINGGKGKGGGYNWQDKRAACFDVPKHHKHLYEEFVEEAKEAAKVAEKGEKKLAGFADTWMSELYHRLYAEFPREVETPDRAAAPRRRLHSIAGELPEFETLRKQTIRDPMWSGIAATSIATTVEATLPARRNRPDADEAKRTVDGIKAMLEMAPDNAKLLEMLKKAEEAYDKALEAADAQAEGIDESAVRQALRGAIAQAQTEIGEAQEALNALGCGQGAGSSRPVDPAASLAVARQVRNSPTLKQIIQLAGRLTLTARAKRAQRTDYARSEVVGIEQTGEVSRLLPTELTALAHPLTTAALVKRLNERNALGYRLRGKDKESRGPIILAIDESGSMMGIKDCWAKAVGLALLDAARTQRRAFGVILYDDGVRRSALFEKPSEVPPQQLVELLAYFSGGGTNFQPPMQLAKKWLVDAEKEGRPIRKADIVHVTDGEAYDHGAKEFLDWATEAGVHVYGVAIATHGGSLGKWAHEVAKIDDVNADTKAVDLVFDKV